VSGAEPSRVDDDPAMMSAENSAIRMAEIREAIGRCIAEGLDFPPAMVAELNFRINAHRRIPPGCLVFRKHIFGREGVKP
jgi:hypothetical protein